MPKPMAKPAREGLPISGARLSQWRAQLVGPVGAVIILPLLVLAAGSSIAWVGSQRLEHIDRWRWIDDRSGFNEAHRVAIAR